MDYQYNDYELIYLIKENSEEALNVMVNKYKPIIHKMAFYYANKYYNYNIDVDDLIQEGYIALIKAIKQYNDEKDSKFFTFLYMCIKRAIVGSVIRLSKKYNYLIDDVKEEDYIFNLYDLKDNTDIIYDEFSSSSKIIEFKNSLEFLESNIFELRYNGFKYREIASLLDINIKKVDNLMLKIKTKLKKYLLTIE